MKIHGALQTPDGAWRVEVVQYGAQVFYRLHANGEVTDRLAIATLTHMLREAGIDWAELIEVADELQNSAPRTT